MFINPIIGMIHNTAANTWHPVLFTESPLPGGIDSPIRHKSRMHHTGGFPSRDEAVQNAQDDLAPRVGAVRFAMAKAFEWDGEGIPSITTFFREINGELQPLM